MVSNGECMSSGDKITPLLELVQKYKKNTNYWVCAFLAITYTYG